MQSVPIDFKSGLGLKFAEQAKAEKNGILNVLRQAVS